MIDIFVDTGASGADDGTSLSDAYESILSAAQNGLDLPTLGDDCTIHLYATTGAIDVLTTTAIFCAGNSWITDATHQLYIIVHDDYFHGGQQDNGYVVQRAVTWAEVLDIQISYVHIIGIAIKGGRNSLSLQTCSGITIENLLIYDGATSGIQFRHSVVAAVVKNASIINCVTGILTNEPLTAAVYASTIVGAVTGINAADSTLIVKNTYVHGSTIAVTGAGLSLENVATSDASGSAGLQNIAYSESAGAYFTSIVAGSEILKYNNLSDLYEAGVDLSGVGVLYDMYENERSDPYDIGSFELIESGGDTEMTGITISGTAWQAISADGEDITVFAWKNETGHGKVYIASGLAAADPANNYGFPLKRPANNKDHLKLTAAVNEKWFARCGDADDEVVICVNVDAS